MSVPNHSHRKERESYIILCDPTWRPSQTSPGSCFYRRKTLRERNSPGVLKLVVSCNYSENILCHREHTLTTEESKADDQFPWSNTSCCRYQKCRRMQPRYRIYYPCRQNSNSNTLIFTPVVWHDIAHVRGAKSWSVCSRRENCSSLKTCHRTQLPHEGSVKSEYSLRIQSEASRYLYTIGEGRLRRVWSQRTEHAQVNCTRGDISSHNQAWFLRNLTWI